MKKEKKEMEYEEAPSGTVKLYNYKEPYMPFTKGHGFQGVLLFDGEEDKVQCHICGLWFESLGRHINCAHNMTAYDYKELVGLNQSTALISESHREKLVAKSFGIRKKNLKPHYKMSEETKAKISATLKKHSMENRNLTGTCPEQLIDRFTKAYTKYGRTPTRDEVGDSFHGLLINTFGSVKQACDIAGIPYRKAGSTVHKTAALRLKKKEESEKMLDMLRNFKAMHKRNPSKSDINRGLIPSLDVWNIHFGSLNKAINLI